MSEAHAVLNALPPAAARAALERCCGATRWVEAMLARRPFLDTPQLLAAADTVFAEAGQADLLEAFSHHPQIGADIAELRRKFANTGDLAAAEQSGAAAADTQTLEALRAANQAYLARFGYIFIVCASGKSAAAMLALLEQRLHNDPASELRIAAAEQAKITKLRLERLA
jgi:2-oxo-4-hydroxy-4-carboxy-5-ureidoimidazoline decarboxylase